MNAHLLTLIVIVCLLNTQPTSVKCSFNDPDLSRTAPELIKSRGFDVQTHYVTTADGYILTLHRIMNPYYKGRPRPVLLQHGLLSSGIDFIINSPGGNVSPTDNQDACSIQVPVGDIGNNLGFALSKLGFDVWLGNSRGNEYSMNHTRWSPKEKRFWQFNFDQMIDFDQPALIEHILNVTNQESLGYIGHSQGTLIMFGLLSTQTKYAKLVKPFIALGPVASLFDIKSPVKYLVDIPFLMDAMMYKGGPFIISDALVRMLSRRFCKVDVEIICNNVLGLLMGYDYSQVNETRLPVYFNHSPAGTSNWNLVHFMQMVKSGLLKRFDYGKKRNLKIYGKSSPPEYPLGNITSRQIALIYGENDWLADPSDVNRLKKSLKVPLLEDYLVPNLKWNHVDFIWAEEAGQYVNRKIVNLLLQSLDCREREMTDNQV